MKEKNHNTIIPKNHNPKNPIHLLIKYLGIMTGYAIILYLFTAWIAWDIDIRYWWDWQLAVFVTAMICFGACMWNQIKSE